MLGNRIKKLRKERSLSLKEMENLTGIKKEYLSRIETNSLPNPTYNTLQQIAKALKIDLRELFDYSPPKPPKLKVFSVNNPPPDSELGNFIAVPIVDQELLGIHPGDPAGREFEDFVMLNPALIPDMGNIQNYRALYLNEKDNSMLPAIPGGSLICIDLGPYNLMQLLGKIALIKHNDAGLIVRYLKIEQDNVLCIPFNIQQYNPVILPRQSSGYILGKVVACFNVIATA